MKATVSLGRTTVFLRCFTDDSSRLKSPLIMFPTWHSDQIQKTVWRYKSLDRSWEAKSPFGSHVSNFRSCIFERVQNPFQLFAFQQNGFLNQLCCTHTPSKKDSQPSSETHENDRLEQELFWLSLALLENNCILHCTWGLKKKQLQI